ncbi:hypothetical protein F5876DRAFT_68670 [Lentinula aff. lateritia]|uniref:Uncharacterized protein n=1 Tax=Lentinula aff. lateritia TaxID=2804960 RepID=A0ACC1TQC4_9AGAR|nr:hypothetical protein F5876DRAFT_68670 [Lentinula aff. lateritia]
MQLYFAVYFAVTQFKHLPSSFTSRLYGVKGIAGLFKLWWRQSSYATHVRLDFSTKCSELNNTFVLEDQGNPLALAKLDPGMIAFLVQHGNKAHESLVFTAIAFTHSLTSLGSLDFIGIVLSQYTELAQLALLDVRLSFTSCFIKLNYAQNVSIVTNVLGIVSDFAITFLMIFLLQKSKTGFKNTTDVLNRLIVFTFNTGRSHLVFFTSNETGLFKYWSRHTDFTMLHRDFNSVSFDPDKSGSMDYIRQGLNSDLTSTNENYALSIPNNALESRLEFAGTNSTTDGISIRIDRDIHTSSSKMNQTDRIKQPCIALHAGILQGIELDGPAKW